MLRLVENAMVANLMASLYCGGTPMASEVSRATPSGKRSAIIFIRVSLRTPPPLAISRFTPSPAGTTNSLKARTMASAVNAVMVASLSSLLSSAYLSSICCVYSAPKSRRQAQRGISRLKNGCSSISSSIG